MSVTGAPLERHWHIDGLDLYGLEWGEPDGHPVLALHGWQDNAASFSRLAPQLQGCRVIAIDLSGQGKSSFRSADSSYQIWDDLPQLDRLVELLGWDQFSLLGHSRGAIIATLFAAVRASRIDRLVLLDAIFPRPAAEADFVAQLASYLDQRMLASQVSLRTYPERQVAVAARAKQDFSIDAAETLASRGLSGEAGAGWYWRNDPRLRGASAVKMTTGQIQSVLNAVTAPVLLLVASEGVMKEYDFQAVLAESSINIDIEYVVGGHHFHMEPLVDEWVATIRKFLGIH